MYPTAASASTSARPSSPPILPPTASLPFRPWISWTPYLLNRFFCDLWDFIYLSFYSLNTFIKCNLISIYLSFYSLYTFLECNFISSLFFNGRNTYLCYINNKSMSFYGETFKIYHSNWTNFEYLFIYTLLNYFYFQTIIMNVSYVISYKLIPMVYLVQPQTTFS